MVIRSANEALVMRLAKIDLDLHGRIGVVVQSEMDSIIIINLRTAGSTTVLLLTIKPT